MSEQQNSKGMPTLNYRCVELQNGLQVECRCGQFISHTAIHSYNSQGFLPDFILLGRGRSGKSRHLSDRVLTDDGKVQQQLSNTQLHHEECCFASLWHRGFKLKAVIGGALRFFDCPF